jgi:uncharacterized membrane protein YcaP (DUF421 family)
MIIVFIRATVLYWFLLISIRVMGKSELGELQPFDFVVSLVLAELATLPMEDLGSPLMHGLMAIATVTFFQCFISYVTLKSNSARKIICGSPTILIDHGIFNTKEMKKLRININDIIGQMRIKGYYSFEDIDYLIIETNGEMSIIGPTDKPGTRCKRIPITVVADGKMMRENLKQYNIQEKEIMKELDKNKLKINQVVYGFVDENEKFVFYNK